MSQTKAQLIDAIDGSIVTADIADDAVNADKLASNSVVSASIVDGSIVNADINASAAIAGSKIADFVSNNTNNRVLTATGTANSLNGEANLTFTGSNLTVTNGSGSSELTLVTPNNTDGGVYFNDGSNSGALSYQHSDNSMRFRVNSTEKMRIDSSGKVGIGTTAPGSVLHVDTGLAGSPLVTFHQTNGASSADAGLEVETSSTGTYIQRWVNSGSEHARITGSGLMGIGTATPQAILHTASAGGDNFEGIRIINTHADANAQNTAFIRLGITNAGGEKTTQISAIQESNAGNAVGLRFGTNSSGSNNGETEKMRITSDGKVGIGTTAPGESLHVAGNIINTENIGSTGDSGIMIGSGHRLGFDQSGTRSWTVKAQDGVLNIASGDGASAPRVAGLLFGSDTAAANTLDDYEEGTFTPTQPSIGTNSAAGTYTKIGRLVTARIFITLPNNSSGQYFVIDGLPFTAINPQSGMDIQGGYVIYSTYGAAVLVRVNAGGTRVVVNGIGGTNIQLTTLDNINFRLQVHYFTA